MKQKKNFIRSTMIKRDYKYLANKLDRVRPIKLEDKPRYPEWLQLLWVAGVMAVVFVGFWSGI
jgi:hypothetical protein